MTEIIESSVPEVLVDTSVSTTVTHIAGTTVTDASTAITVIETDTVTTITETARITEVVDGSSIEVITDVQNSTLVVLDTATQLIETAEQGPPGPPGPPSPTAASYPGKTLVWSQGKLSEVRLYSDAAKTQLAERRVMSYTGDVLTSIAFYDSDGALTKTRTLGYGSGVLTGVTES